MKTLICISHVPDTTTKIQYSADGSELDTTGVTFVINPFDEFGLVRAIEFKEQSGAGSVTTLCVGGPEVEPTLRKTLAIGADDAVRINGQAHDAFYVAKQIAEYAKDKGFDIIFAGKESIDHNGSQVPGMVAELLDMPFVSLAIKVDDAGDSLNLQREIDGGYEVMTAPKPVVISTQKGVAEWRIPNMRGIMQARRKPLNVVEPVDAQPRVKTTKLELPPEKGGCEYIEPDNAGQLITMLHDKGII